MKRNLLSTSATLVAAAMLAATFSPLAVADDQPVEPRSGVIDSIVFGDAPSEQAHDFAGSNTSVVDGVGDLTARVATPLTPAKNFLGELTFTVAVDPHAQNYLTLKTWGEDASAYKTVAFVDGEQIGYRAGSDWEALNFGTMGALADRFLFNTTMIPLESSQGRSEVQIILRSYSGLSGTATANSLPYYEAFTATEPQVQAMPRDASSYMPTTTAAPEWTEAQQLAKVDAYSAKLVSTFNALSTAADASATAKLSIERYKEDLRFYAESIQQSWSPANTSALKRAAVERILKSVDQYVTEYYGNVDKLAEGGHQSDWGGYYSILGEVLYIIEPLLTDEAIYGQARLNAFLAEPFVTGTVDGANSIAGVDANGGSLERKEAWERMLKASFDFSRSRLSYIYNQVLYTYEGAWKAGEGLRIIGSDAYEGKERAHQIALEALGAAPFLGEEVLVGPDGEDLDLYHDLFKHDNTFEATDDVKNIVMRGLASSKLDAEGQVVRRLPYGEHYTGLTDAGLTRENGYVGGYGESSNYLPNWFYRTLGHAGDESLNQAILKVALKNLNARAQTRYPGEDADGYRAMFEQQVIDDRTNAYPGRMAYGVEAGKGVALLYAGLEKYMVEHEAAYAGPEWEQSWAFARDAVGYAQQQLIDNQYFPTFDGSVLANYKYDLTLPDTYRYLTADRAGFTRFGTVSAGVVLPQTDLRRYTDAELAELGVERTDLAESSAWVDIDNLLVSARDGNTRIFANLAERNKGFSGSGRAHVQVDGYDQITQLATEGDLVFEDYILRPASYEDAIIFDRYTNADDRPLANAGELMPIAYQPGVGTVSRENYIGDTPYAGYPDLAVTRFGDYLMAVNTTRAVYGNERTKTVTLPPAFGGATVRDLVSGSELAVVDGSIQLAPRSAVVLVIGDTAKDTRPEAIDAITTVPGEGSVGLDWNPTDEAAGYTVARSASANGPFVTVASDVTTTAYLDTGVPVGTWYYTVAAGNEGGATVSKPVEAVVTAARTAAVAATGWRDDLIGSATAATVNVTGTGITIAGADGDGFADGDDNRALERFRPDSTVLVSRTLQGSGSVSADLSQLDGDEGGIILRDSLEGTGRYVYLGATADGSLELRTRSLDTRANLGLGKAGVDASGGAYPMSPSTIELEDLNVASTPQVKLIRDASSGLVTALSSADGVSWQRIATDNVPMPDAVNVGVTAPTQAQFAAVEVTKIEDGLAVPTVMQRDDQATIAWNKPKNAVAFDVYRTEDPALAGTDPRTGADGWTKILDDRYALNVTDAARTDSVSYAVVARFVDGSTQLGAATAAAAGEDIDDVLARAKALVDVDYTRGSFYVLTATIGRVEAALAEPTADRSALRTELYGALDLLRPRADAVKIDVLGAATVTTSHVGHAGSGPKDEVGKKIFDGSIATTLTLASANNAWVQVDLGTHPAALTKVRAYPQPNRADTIARLNNAQIQGSNNGSTWTTLGTFTGVTTAKWYEIEVTDASSYRYLRFAGAPGSSASVTELEYYTPQLDRSLVDVLLSEVQSLDGAVYTEQSWSSLDSAVDAAQALSATATQDEVDAAAAAIIAAREALVLREVEPAGPATTAPGVGSLSNTSGWATGLADGNFDVRMNLWWGSNATRYELYENGVLIATTRLTDATPAAQSVSTPIRGKVNGSYVYTGVLTNRHGSTSTSSTTVVVTAAAPGTGVLSHDNWSGTGSYSVTFNLWWGTNGSSYRLYENDVLVDSRSLTPASPNAQSVTTSVAGKPAGTYVYRAELENPAGTTETAPITVTVK